VRGAVATDVIEQADDLGLAQCLGQALCDPGCAEVERRIRRGPLLVEEETVQTTQDRQRACLGCGAPPGIAQRPEVGRHVVRCRSERVESLRGQCLLIGAEVTTVGDQCQPCAALLDRQPREVLLAPDDSAALGTGSVA